MCRSCAGVSSLSKIDDVDVGLGRRGRERRDLAGAEKRRRVGLRALLQHAQHDLGAGGFGQAGELLERSLGLEPARPAGNQADERRALAVPLTLEVAGMPFDLVPMDIAPGAHQPRRRRP